MMCYSFAMISLAERRKNILISIVKEYIKTARPVSSKHLGESSGFTFSSATLRNNMAELERDGYLTQPHTSAGRIPTVLGYRYYVDAFSKKFSLGLAQRRFIMDFFLKQQHLEELLKKTCHFMAQITPYMGVITKYAYSLLSLKHVDLVPLKNSQLLIVVITNTGEVFEDRFEVTKYDFDLQKLEQVLNKEFAGLKLEAIKQKCEHLKALGLFGTLFNEISAKLAEILEKQQTTLFYDGITNLLSLPEFAKISRFFQIFNFLEEEIALKKIGPRLEDDSIYIAIGSELKSTSISEASLILVPYRQDEQIVGAVGILGPMRMDYEKAIATTECVAGNLSMSLKKMA